MDQFDTNSGRPLSSLDWQHIPRETAERTHEFTDKRVLDDLKSGDDPGPEHTPTNRLRWPILLFVATCLSTYYTGGMSSARQAGETAGIFGREFVTGGLIYSTAIMTILLCHEFGHYIQARRYGVPASLPFFIPMPISPLGTMGAVIGMGGRIPTRKALFDIGISGPLAGLVPALICTWIGLQYAQLIPATTMQPGEPVFFMMPIYAFLANLHFGEIAPGMMITDHPLALAGWAGIFVTALNLIPIGQLDGGHILYSMLRRWSYPITSLLLYGALAAMVLTGNYGWSLMVMLLLMSGPLHPPTHDDTEPLGWGRTILGWTTLSFIVVGFTPVPIAFAP